MKKPEPVQIVKKRRDAALQRLIGRVPYIAFMGFEFDRRGDELTGVMPYRDTLIGNPMLPRAAWRGHSRVSGNHCDY